MRIQNAISGGIRQKAGPEVNAMYLGLVVYTGSLMHGSYPIRKENVSYMSLTIR